jgi:excisionase family DNA binding protein
MYKIPRRVFYTPAQIAEMFGVTRRTVYSWITNGHMPATKAGPKLWQVTQEQLDVFLAVSERTIQHPQQPQEEAVPVAPAAAPAPQSQFPARMSTPGRVGPPQTKFPTKKRRR